jgi:NAD+ kinase
MRLFVLGNGSKPGVRAEADRLLPLLAPLGEVAAFDLDQKVDLGPHDADVALVLGGDGAILRAARQMAYRQVPVLGINLGRLGFLADIGIDEVEACLPQLARREYRVTSHLMFECSYTPAGGPPQTFLGLNDVVVETGPPFHMVDFQVEADGETVLQCAGDGLILSTPVGSTAHNLAAGGPVLGQGLRAFVLTPIAAHTLTSRPLVDSAEKVYTIRLRRGHNAWLVVDGQAQLPLRPDDGVMVRRAAVEFQLVKVPGRSYYQTLRDKLGWGTTPSYRPEPK